MMFFASDNGSGVAPEILAAMARANDGYARGYGADQIMDRVRQTLRDLFEAPEAAVFLVASGTAANALALASYCPPWGTVFCHRHAHIAEDECGAPEFYMHGAKLSLVDGAHGLISPDALRDSLARIGDSGVHGVQRAMLSVTTVSEAGTVYSCAEIAALTTLAKTYGLACHLDGARFANALVAIGATPAEMTWKAGIDVVSFGGTKNGCMGVEAVIFFDPAKAWEFELRRKRGGHLLSKHRYLSAQMDAYLTDDLWLRLAGQANALVALGATPAEMTWKAGIDVVSFGGTKNGCMGVEAVIFFDPAKAWEFELRRKRGGHLLSKHRYLSAQMDAYLTDDLWLRLAGQANAMGALLAQGVSEVEEAALLHPAQANMMFPEWQAGTHAKLEAAGAVYYPYPAPSGRERARLVTSWSTTEADVQKFLTALRA